MADLQIWWCRPPEPRPPAPGLIIKTKGNLSMAQLGGYGAETKDEKAEREARERTYGKTNETKPKEKR